VIPTAVAVLDLGPDGQRPGFTVEESTNDGRRVSAASAVDPPAAGGTGGEARAGRLLCRNIGMQHDDSTSPG